MAKDARALRDEAAEATAAGKYKRALAAYLELERIEPRDAQWAKRAGETYRRLNNTKLAIEAFNRSAERYAQNGFLVQAMAVCKLVLQIDPAHADTLRRLATMNEQVGAGPTRVSGMAENNPSLHENPHVAALRGTTADHGPPMTGDPLDALRPRSKPSTPAPLHMPRTKSRPVSLPPGASLESISLSQQLPVIRDLDRDPGIHEISLEDEPNPAAIGYDPYGTDDDVPLLEVDEAVPIPLDPDESTELELADLEEVPMGQPRALGHAARRALAATPLFAGLPSDALEALVENLALVPLRLGEQLYREGEPSDALYVIVEGEISVVAEGPPRVEMARLGPGGFLGEVALMTDQPRTATAIAAEPSELLRIDRLTLSRVLADHGDVLRAVLRFVRDRLVDRWMRTSPLFRPFNDAQRAELASRFTFLEIDAGTTLIGAGLRPDGLYIVLAGQFVVHRDSRTVATLGPGDLIGETALLSGGTFKSDVIAHGKSLALCLPAAAFREVIMTHPHVLEYIGEQAEHSRRLQIL